MTSLSSVAIAPIATAYNHVSSITSNLQNNNEIESRAYTPEIIEQDGIKLYKIPAAGWMKTYTSVELTKPNFINDIKKHINQYFKPDIVPDDATMIYTPSQCTTQTGFVSIIRFNKEYDSNHNSVVVQENATKYNVYIDGCRPDPNISITDPFYWLKKREIERPVEEPYYTQWWFILSITVGSIIVISIPTVIIIRKVVKKKLSNNAKMKALGMATDSQNRIYALEFKEKIQKKKTERKNKSIVKKNAKKEAEKQAKKKAEEEAKPAIPNIVK